MKKVKNLFNSFDSEMFSKDISLENTEKSTYEILNHNITMKI